MLEAIAHGDANRQFEQVRNFVTRGVDGIIIVPKDAQTVIPMIRHANEANVPIVLFNRLPAASDARSVTVVADIYAITKDTVAYLAAQAVKTPGRHKAAILIGDLGDVNAIGRRGGFEDALKPQAGNIEIVARSRAREKGLGACRRATGPTGRRDALSHLRSMTPAHCDGRRWTYVRDSTQASGGVGYDDSRYVASLRRRGSSLALPSFKVATKVELRSGGFRCR